jgi:hypothetical protein
MYCKDDALPQKALCSVCLQDTERRRAQTSILPSQRKEYEREMYPPAEPASHIARLLAFCLDLLVLGIISQLILFFAFQLMEIDYRFLKDVLQPSGGVWSVEALDKLRIISFVSVASLAVPAILYNVIFEASFLGATPGKLSLGLISAALGHCFCSYGMQCSKDASLVGVVRGSRIICDFDRSIFHLPYPRASRAP